MVIIVLERYEGEHNKSHLKNTCDDCCSVGVKVVDVVAVVVVVHLEGRNSRKSVNWLVTNLQEIIVGARRTSVPPAILGRYIVSVRVAGPKS